MTSHSDFIKYVLFSCKKIIQIPTLQSAKVIIIAHPVLIKTKCCALKIKHPKDHLYEVTCDIIKTAK